MKAWVCFFFAAVFLGLGLLVVPESVRDFVRLNRMAAADVQATAEVVSVQTVRVPRKVHDGAGTGPYDVQEDATLRYEVGGAAYTCVARLYRPLGQTKPGDRTGVLYVESDPGRCYLPNAVQGSRVMAVLFPLLLLGLGTGLGYVGLFLRAAGRETS